MSDDEFFNLTPRQFHLLLDHHEREVEHAELLAGIISSTIANWSMASPKEALKATAFMPSEWSKNTRTQKRRINRKQIAANVRAVFAPFVPKVNT